MISEIRTKISNGQYEFSKHAVDQTIKRKINIDDICKATEEGEIIENYPDDKYGPSCLIYGRTMNNRHLHIQCSYPTREMIKIITVYEPDKELWIDFKVRRTV